jgi:aspartate/methionine/tyrosine aminotransferase
MRIDLFRMERMQCLWESAVSFNLSESGVTPVTVDEILEGGSRELGGQALSYPPSAGSRLLRRRIAAWYPGATPDNILVANGGSEANFTTLWGLLEPGTRAAVMIPNYLQARGLARVWAAGADPFRLVETYENGAWRWALDEDSLRRAVGPRTRVIVVTNPNNPTGHVLTGGEMAAIVRAARRARAWLVVDEVYRGAEVGSGDGRPPASSPTFWGMYGKVVVTSGLSKAFGLPGLRIGWIVGPPRLVARLAMYQDYTTLTPAMLSDRLAAVAMEPARREALLARTRTIILKSLPPLQAWISRQGDLFRHVPPRAGAIALLRYDLPIGSERLFERLRDERSVLVTPGAHFGIGRYIRVGFGYDVARTIAGLRRCEPVFAELRAGRGGRVRSRRGRSSPG